MEDINKSIQNEIGNRRLNILKGFSDCDNILEKAKTDGEIHPNGKWRWVSSAAGGKGDWRVIPQSERRNRTAEGGEQHNFPTGIFVTTPDGDGKVIGPTKRGDGNYIAVQLEDGSKKQYYSDQLKKQTEDYVHKKLGVGKYEKTEDKKKPTSSIGGMKKIVDKILNKHTDLFSDSKVSNSTEIYKNSDKEAHYRDMPPRPTPVFKIYQTKDQNLETKFTFIHSAPNGQTIERIETTDISKIEDYIDNSNDSKKEQKGNTSSVKSTPKVADKKTKSSGPTSPMGMTYDEHMAEMKRYDQITSNHDSGIKKISNDSYSKYVDLSHKHYDYAQDLKNKKSN